MEELEKVVVGFMERRFKGKLRTLNEIENPKLFIPYHVGELYKLGWIIYIKKE